ncbi:MAG TPA: hypothetical protein DIU39_02700 [Flavobacteriales bacterium]|nr:hypothetical protein [Flavobacteriales bacterium]|tara:strand:+ start:47382 stop:47711 length:330 start_codon:yes stop_codon:yes gene_type:complete
MLRNLFFYSLISLVIISCTPKPVAFDSPWLGKNVTALYKSLGEPDRKEKISEGEKWIYVQKIAYFGKKPPKENQPPKFFYIIERIFSINKKGIVFKYEVFKYKEKVKNT